jgi:hypothetical protein
MKRARELAALAGLSAFLASVTAFATERVVIVAEPESPVMSRMSAELGGLGFSVDEVPSSAGVTPETLEQCAQEHDALAAILLTGEGRGAEIWIADRATDKIVLRRIRIDESGVTGDDAVTKAVELLRASLLEVRVQRSKKPIPEAVERLVGPKGPPAASPPPQVAAPEPPVVTVRMSPSVAFRAGGVPPSPQIAIDVSGWLDDVFGVGAALSIPVFPISNEVPEGEITRTQFWAEATFEAHPYRGVVDPRLGVGVGLEIAGADGNANAAFTSGSATTVSALGLAEVGLAVPIGAVFALDSHVECGITLPRIHYLAAGRNALSADWPACAAGVGGALTF